MRDRDGAGKSASKTERERESGEKEQQLAANICYKKSVTNLSERQTKGNCEV